MPRIPRFGRPGAPKIRQPPATPDPVEAASTPPLDETGAAVPPAPLSDDSTAATAAPTPAGEPAGPDAPPDAGAPETEGHSPATRIAAVLAGEVHPTETATAAEAPAAPAPAAAVSPAQIPSAPAPAAAVSPAETPSGPAPEAAATPAPAAPADPAAVIPAEAPPESPGFRERATLRRRLRFLRSARELAFRDLGGLMFELHRRERSREDLVSAKLATLARIDSELRVIERALDDRQPITVLHEAGIAACRRCSAIHGSDARYCPNCGVSFGRRALVPIAAPTITPEAEAGAEATPAPPPGEAPAATGLPTGAGDEVAADTAAASDDAAAPAHSGPAPVRAPAIGAGHAADAAPHAPLPPAPADDGPHTGSANGAEGTGRAPLPPAPAGADDSEQPTRVADAVTSEDAEPSAR